MTLEQRRRDLKGSDPDFYSYIANIEWAKALDTAGDHASGASNGHGAANRCWGMSARRKRLAQEANAANVEA